MALSSLFAICSLFAIDILSINNIVRFGMEYVLLEYIFSISWNSILMWNRVFHTLYNKNTWWRLSCIFKHGVLLARWIRINVFWLLGRWYVVMNTLVFVWHFNGVYILRFDNVSKRTEHRAPVWNACGVKIPKFGIGTGTGTIPNYRYTQCIIESWIARVWNATPFYHKLRKYWFIHYGNCCKTITYRLFSSILLKNKHVCPVASYPMTSPLVQVVHSNDSLLLMLHDPCRWRCLSRDHHVTYEQICPWIDITSRWPSVRSFPTGWRVLAPGTWELGKQWYF